MDLSISSQYDAEARMWVVKPAGEIDIFNSSEFKHDLMELINSKEADLCIDCAKLDYIDSTALGVLMAVLKKVKEYDGNFLLKNLKPNLSKLFKITNLDKVFIILVGDNDEK